MFTPVFSFDNSVLSKSLLSDATLRYSSIVFFCSAVVMISTSGCSGASTRYVAPNIVSGLVVNTFTACASSTLKDISAPSDLPIQCFCISFVEAGHSTNSKSFKSLSAYFVMRIIHCRMGLRSTVYPLSFHSSTSSLARTVPNSSHQFTGILAV